jgi:DNA-binding transcriptional ArsR family regulator
MEILDQKISYRKLARLLQSIGQPARLKILLAIGQGEACVCHLEAALGMRQAYISQHLMKLRKAGVVLDRREGRYIFYRLANQEILELIQHAGDLVGMAPLQVAPQAAELEDCLCPSCTPAEGSNLGSDGHSDQEGKR